MTDYSEILKRLRHYDAPIFDDAAAAIEALQDELALSEGAGQKFSEVSAEMYAGLQRDRDHWKARAERAEAVAADLADPAGEYYTGLGCGLEDRDIHDRYEAAVYGWQQAFEYINSAEPALDHQEGEQ